MPRVSIPVTQCTDLGVVPPAQTNGDATNDHQLDFNDGRIVLEVVTTAADTMTIITPGLVGGLAVADQVVALPIGTKMVGPFSPAIYNQADGTVQIDITVSTTTKFRAYRV